MIHDLICHCLGRYMYVKEGEGERDRGREGRRDCGRELFWSDTCNRSE